MRTIHLLYNYFHCGYSIENGTGRFFSEVFSLTEAIAKTIETTFDTGIEVLITNTDNEETPLSREKCLQVQDLLTLRMHQYDELWKLKYEFVNTVLD